jgi:hypothetical protein
MSRSEGPLWHAQQDVLNYRRLQAGGQNWGRFIELMEKMADLAKDHGDQEKYLQYKAEANRVRCAKQEGGSIIEIWTAKATALTREADDLSSSPHWGNNCWTLCLPVPIVKNKAPFPVSGA